MTPVFDEPSNLEPGVDESVVKVGNRSVEDGQLRFVVLVDRNLPRASVEIAPLDTPRVVIEILVEGMWHAEYKDTAIPQDAMGFEESLVEMFDHLESCLGGRYVEPVVSERKVRHVTFDKLDFNAVEVP